MEKSGSNQVASNSIEDVSEYADAEENIPAPTELLAEFLHSLMVKDYEKALGYCTQILSYEPNYSTIREFRPLIEEKLEMLRNEDFDDDSSNSSLSCSSSTSSSSGNLHSIKNETSWEVGSLNCSSLESDESNGINGIRKRRASHSDIANKNTETCTSLTKEDFTNHNCNEINTSATRTVLNAKLLAHKTQTRVLRRDSTEGNLNNEFDNLKNENSSTLLHPTNTRVLKKDKSLSPDKENTSRAFAWFSSLQENIFGSRKRESSSSKKSVQNSKNTNNAKGKKTH